MRRFSDRLLADPLKRYLSRVSKPSERRAIVKDAKQLERGLGKGSAHDLVVKRSREALGIAAEVSPRRRAFKGIRPERELLTASASERSSATRSRHEAGRVNRERIELARAEKRKLQGASA